MTLPVFALDLKLTTSDVVLPRFGANCTISVVPFPKHLSSLKETKSHCISQIRYMDLPESRINFIHDAFSIFKASQGLKNIVDLIRCSSEYKDQLLHHVLFLLQINTTSLREIHIFSGIHVKEGDWHFSTFDKIQPSIMEKDLLRS